MRQRSTKPTQCHVRPAKTGLPPDQSLRCPHEETVRVYLEEDIIKEVNHQKLFGIIIDRNLTWDKQIDAVCLNVTRRITLFKLLSKYVNKSGLKQYYNSYILLAV